MFMSIVKLFVITGAFVRIRCYVRLGPDV